MRGGGQQRLTAGDPVASEDAVLTESDVLEPVAHLLCAPLRKRHLQVSDMVERKEERSALTTETFLNEIHGPRTTHSMFS